MAALVGAAILAAPTQARADYAIRIFDDGNLEFQRGTGSDVGAGVFGTFGNSLIFTSATTHFSITNGSGLSNNPGTQGGSNLDLSTNEQITTAFGSIGGTHNIRIELSQTDWLAPTGSPLVLSSSAGGSMGSVLGGGTPSASVAATYQGFLSTSNALFAEPVAGSTPIQNASASLTTAGTASLVYSPGTAVNPLVPGGTPFSMTDSAFFSFTVNAGSGQVTANVSGSTVASVPAPAALVLALTGAPVLGVGTWLRRRRQAV